MKSKFLDWLIAKSPGVITDLDAEIQIAHSSGKMSTLWKNPGVAVPQHLGPLLDFYSCFLGANLFSSVFKIAPLSDDVRRGDATILYSISNLRKACRESNARFPELSVPFMTRAGIGYYALTPEGLIIEWDIEEELLTGTYGNITQVLEEWIVTVEGY